MGKHFSLERLSIYMTELPTQHVTVPGHHGKPISLIGSEINGNHPCVILAIKEDGQSAIVAPLTSALDGRGGEKYRNVSKSWLRILHQKHPSYVLLDQIRSCDRARFMRMEEPLGDHDRGELELRLKFWFQLV